MLPFSGPPRAGLTTRVAAPRPRNPTQFHRNFVGCSSGFCGFPGSPLVFFFARSVSPSPCSLLGSYRWWARSTGSRFAVHRHLGGIDGVRRMLQPLGSTGAHLHFLTTVASDHIPSIQSTILYLPLILARSQFWELWDASAQSRKLQFFLRNEAEAWFSIFYKYVSESG